MPHKLLISVVIPCYNIREQIEATVKSICTQTYKKLEIILVDDGSTDGTADVLDELASTDDRIRVIHKANGGVTWARLTGVNAAAGEYIGFVDGDDALAPEMYEVLLNNALARQADISHCGYKKICGSKEDLFHGSGVIVEQDKNKGINDLLSGKLVEPGLCNKLYKKELFVGLEEKMDFSIKINEDLLMNFYLFEKSRYSVFEDRCLYHYIIREDSASHSSQAPEKIMDPVKAAKAIFEHCKNDPQLRTEATRLYAIKLIQVASKSKKNKELRQQICSARKMLHSHLSFYLKQRGINGKDKIQTTFAALLPELYGNIHSLYVTKKYR